MFLVFITAMLVLCFVSLDMVFFGCIKQLVGELVLSKNWNFCISFCGFDCFGIIVWWAQLSFYALLHTLLKWIVWNNWLMSWFLQGFFFLHTCLSIWLLLDYSFGFVFSMHTFWVWCGKPAIGGIKCSYRVICSHVFAAIGPRKGLLSHRIGHVWKSSYRNAAIAYSCVFRVYSCIYQTRL